MAHTLASVVPVAIAVLEVATYVVYARAVVRREIRPSRATWLIWAPLLWLTVASSADAGAGIVLIKAVSTAVGCTVIALFAIRYGTGGWSRSDRVCVVLAALGVVAWVTLDDPVLGLACFILADAVGGVPTLRDMARDPTRERPHAWILCAAASVLTLLLVRPESWQLSGAGFAEWAYPVYMLGLNAAILSVLTLSFVRRPLLRLVGSRS